MTDDLDTFAQWASALDIGDVPEDVLARVRLQVASAFAAARAGTTAEWVDAGTAATAGSATATVVGGDRADVYTAAFTNAAAHTVHDYDDYLFMGHTGHSGVFASLAVCERADLGGATLLENALIANELAGRLGAAVAVGPHNGQMWAFIHQASAAAVAARTRGDADAVREAVRMALYNPDYPLEAGFIDGESKALTAAAPTATGLRVGDAAVRGATGTPDALGEFLSSYAYLPFREMVGGFGDSWVTRTASFKPRPGCAYVQAPLACLERITDSGVRADDIEQIRVRAPLLTVAMEGLSRPYRGAERRLLPVNITFSVPYTLALHLLGGVTPDRLTRSFVTDHRSELDALAATVELDHDWGLTAGVLGGLSAGIDYGPLIRDRGLVATARGLKQLGDAHSSVDTTGEAAALLQSGETRTVLDALRSPLSWDEFDVGAARFEDLTFEFGAVVDVETTTDHYRARANDHPGACGRPLDSVTGVVREKVERELGDSFDIFSDAQSRDIDELAGLLGA